MIEEFIKLSQAESPLFASMLDTMSHSKKNDGRRLLCLYNNIIDEILEAPRTSEDEVNYQIIHMPNCPKWARELMFRFIIHKSALTFNSLTLDRLNKSIHRGDIILTSDPKESKRCFTEITERNAYCRKVVNAFSKYNIPNNASKSIVAIKQQDLITTKIDKNSDLELLYADDICNSDYNLAILVNKSAYELEQEIKQTQEPTPNIKNIFIFHSNNKQKITNSYNIKQLDRLNRYGAGIMNCVVFSFSEQPLKLFHTIDNVKNRIISNLLYKDTKFYDSFDGFVTFTQEESNYLFNQKNNQSRHVINSADLQFFISDIDNILDDTPNNLWCKNLLSLSFSKKLQTNYFKVMSIKLTPLTKELWADYFNILSNLWIDQIKVKVEEFIENSHTIAFIVSHDTPQQIKMALRNQFQNNDRQIIIRSLKDMKSAKGIKSKKIVVFQYRYTDIIYKSYPNSFDPLPLNECQEALVVINELTHYNYYKWGQYRYNKALNGLLFSQFRQKHLSWSKIIFHKPSIIDIKDFIDESEANERGYHAEKCKVYYKDARPKEHLSCERILYKHNNEYKISLLKDLCSIDGIAIKLLDELTEQVKLLITEKIKDNSKLEEYIKRDEKYKLTEEEINSTVELWKILLQKRVLSLGEESVYTAIVGSLQEDDKVSKNTFVNWYDFNNPMMLPRSRKCQNVLLKYLGFEIGSPYYKVILTKKLTSINKTRSLNSQIDNLLQSVLLTCIDEDMYELLSETYCDVFTLLEINNAEDVETLKGLLDISLKEIDKIECENDTE